MLSWDQVRDNLAVVVVPQHAKGMMSIIAKSLLLPVITVEGERIELPFLLDGFPRTITQADALQEGLEKRGFKLDKAVNINVPEEVLVNRLAGRRVCKNCGKTYHKDMNPPKKDGVCEDCNGEVIQRADDKEEVILNRIKVYENQTQPLIDYYEKLNLLVTIDGTMGIEQVFNEIIKELR